MIVEISIDGTCWRNVGKFYVPECCCLYLLELFNHRVVGSCSQLEGVGIITYQDTSIYRAKSHFLWSDSKNWGEAHPLPPAFYTRPINIKHNVYYYIQWWQSPFIHTTLVYISDSLAQLTFQIDQSLIFLIFNFSYVLLKRNLQ